MVETLTGQKVERQQLQHIIGGLTEGVILIDPDQTIAWANDAALRMHGAVEISDLGCDVDEYRHRYQLRYRNNHPLDQGAYPADRVVAGEMFTDVVVEVSAVAPAGAGSRVSSGMTSPSAPRCAGWNPAPGP